jgi:hypothetical protein
MSYFVQGLPPELFRPLFELGDNELSERRAVRVTADGPGFPCRVSLEHAAPGEELILVNYLSHAADTPYRTAFAIYVREAAGEAARFEDRLPPMFESKTLSLRGYDGEGMLRGALLAQPGAGDRLVRELFERAEIATVHAHSATYGCFLARIERS